MFITQIHQTSSEIQAIQDNNIVRVSVIELILSSISELFLILYGKLVVSVTSSTSINLLFISSSFCSIFSASSTIVNI